jgi:hypothetical protein
MRSRSAVLLMAIGAGILLTVVLTFASYLLDKIGANSLASVFFWPNSLLQSAAPCVRGSGLERPFCEGTPINALAFVASFPLSIAAYSAIAYIILRRYTHHNNKSSSDHGTG